MTAAAFPEDSILRRHADTERRRCQGVPPTDSVLRRHYEQLQTMGSAPAPAVQAKPAHTATVTPISRPQPAAAPAQARQAEPQAAQGGGLLGWLKRLLSA